MRRLFPKLGLVGIVVAAVMIFLCFTTLAAEKKKFVFNLKSIKNISTINLNAPQDKNNQITQWVRQDSFTEHTDSSLVGAEITVYGTMDRLTYGGVHNSSGYNIGKSKDGDFFYYKWQSTGLVTVPHETNWEVEYNKKIQFIGGTGKYRTLKGTATCKGTITPAGHAEKCEGEWEY